MTGGYDDGYAAHSCFWGREPGSLLVRLTESIPSFSGMHVLDVGCGEGKNAAFLASRGAIVDAMDISALALANAQTAWPHSRVRWVQGDARVIQFRARHYDIVIAYGLLHCLDTQEQVSETIKRLQAATATAGWNVICVFNDRRQELLAHPGFQPILCTHEWLTHHYSDWRISVCTDEDLTESHPTNNIVHVHSMTRLIAQSNMP